MACHGERAKSRSRRHDEVLLYHSVPNYDRRHRLNFQCCRLWSMVGTKRALAQQLLTMHVQLCFSLDLHKVWGFSRSDVGLPSCTGALHMGERPGRPSGRSGEDAAQLPAPAGAAALGARLQGLALLGGPRQPLQPGVHLEIQISS